MFRESSASWMIRLRSWAEKSVIRHRSCPPARSDPASGMVTPGVCSRRVGSLLVMRLVTRPRSARRSMMATVRVRSSSVAFRRTRSCTRMAATVSEKYSDSRRRPVVCQGRSSRGQRSAPKRAIADQYCWLSSQRRRSISASFCWSSSSRPRVRVRSEKRSWMPSRATTVKYT
ncbi:hypothetical protein STENM223S_00710 [Streptomyces tendae]